MSNQNRSLYLKYADSLRHSNDFSTPISEFFAPEANINVVHPFNSLTGANAYISSFVIPFQHSFKGLYRRDDIFMAGSFEGQDWVSSTGYYVGHFEKDWIGLKATNTLCYLRYGEFHRIENNKAVESYIFLDIPELMIACKQWPLGMGPGHSRGYTGLIQGPASQDGVLKQDTDPTKGQKSYQIVTDMLNQLATQDEAWRPYWHKNMM